jgi:hypothetical protein
VADLFGPQLGRFLGPPLIAILLASAIMLAWSMRNVATTDSGFALAVSLQFAITAVTLLPGHAMYDRVVLLPGILLIALRWRSFASRPAFRVVLLATAVALFWQWFLVAFLLSVRPLISPARFFSTAVFTLPIRTAGAYPFGVLALLGWMMCAMFRGNVMLNPGESTEIEPGT